MRAFNPEAMVLRTLLQSLLIGTVISGCSNPTDDFPMPEKIAQEIEQHGDVRVDDYFWMNDRDDPNVIAWLKKQNDRVDEVMAPSASLQQSLIREMKQRIPEEDISAPYRDGDYWYYHRYTKGNEYPIYCRKRGSLDAAEEILLDVNELAGDATFFAVRNFEVSPDHKLAAYAVDTQGRNFFDIFFLDLQTGKLLPDRIEKVTSNYE
ncbi:MAG: oligopeptidase B, partial [Gammaproteobacteria bacterium]|nr:oligopeptidase B [Gammaproteobacteria bacterium]